MGKADVWRRCEAIAEQLRIPDPFDMHVLVDRIGADHGVRVELLPASMRDGEPSGLGRRTAGSWQIVYSKDTTVLHQEHIICHELAHFLHGHQGATWLSGADLTAAFPDLPPELLAGMFARDVYSNTEEQEAELLASMILARGGRHPMPPKPVAAELAGGMARLGRLFGPDCRG